MVWGQARGVQYLERRTGRAPSFPCAGAGMLVARCNLRWYSSLERSSRR
jgi:hypothetical protein